MRVRQHRSETRGEPSEGSIWAADLFDIAIDPYHLTYSCSLYSRRLPIIFVHGERRDPLAVQQAACRASTHPQRPPFRQRRPSVQGPGSSAAAQRREKRQRGEKRVHAALLRQPLRTAPAALAACESVE